MQAPLWSCHSIALILLLALGPVDSAEATQPDWENEQMIGQNKEPAHATLLPYASLQQALTGRRDASPYFKLLNGDWKFHWVPNPDARPQDFYRGDYDVSGWDTIDVPSHWQLRGHGVPIYTNVRYPFKNDWPHVTGAAARRLDRLQEPQSGWIVSPRFHGSRGLARTASLHPLRRRQVGVLPLGQWRKGRL